MIFNIFFLLLVFLWNLINYFSIRDIIESIAWCDKGGKGNKFAKIKKSQPLLPRLRMKYLLQYVDDHKKEFAFWMTVKSFYVILETFLITTYIVCSILTVFVDIICSIIVIQALIWLIVLRLQTSENRLTKYDIMRISKRRKK